MGRSDPGMRGPEVKVEDPQQPCLLCPPQRGVPAFTVPQPDGPLAVLRERAEQIAVSDWRCRGAAPSFWAAARPAGALWVLGPGLGSCWWGKMEELTTSGGASCPGRRQQLL